jgi:hypothetical protein
MLLVMFEPGKEFSSRKASPMFVEQIGFVKDPTVVAALKQEHVMI